MAEDRTDGLCHPWRVSNFRRRDSSTRALERVGQQKGGFSGMFSASSGPLISAFADMRQPLGTFNEQYRYIHIMSSFVLLKPTLLKTKNPVR